MTLNRRQFLAAAARGVMGGALGGAMGVAAATLAPGVFLIQPARARPTGSPASPRVRWGMLIDTNKRAEIWDACVEACKNENGWQGPDREGGRPATDPQWIRRIDLKDRNTGATHSLPMMCQHCENAPCVDVCPTGASFRRADGIVLVDRHTCIGCRYCMLACPFAARSFVHEDVTDQKPYLPRGKGTVESCTFCVHRLDDDRLPACVETASHMDPEAILFGDLNDPTSGISRAVSRHVVNRVRADLGLNPGVLYRGL